MRFFYIVLISLFFWKTSWCQNISIVTSSNNSSLNLSRTEIEDLFLGRKNTFPNGQKVEIIVKSESVPDHKIFTEQFLLKSMSAFKSQWARLIFTGRASPLTVVNTDEQVKKEIIENANSLGYISTSSLSAELKELASLEAK
jgi:ABC-type phosphate transport system substrate-binding protein